MDFVYFCRPGDNEELRYSIRSLYANFPNPKVWVVGERPSWYTGNFIYVPQNGAKFFNVVKSIQAVINSDDIASTFILMNDDFFILKPIDSIPVFHRGTIASRIESYSDFLPRSSYIRMLQATNSRLKKMGVSNPINYELHIPMQLGKKLLTRILSPNTLWRSMYGNLAKVGGAEMEDVKLYASGIFANHEDRPFESFDIFLSTDDSSFLLVKDNLSNLFPTPSINEA